MINRLSILIPVYNDNAVPLVRELCAQAMRIDGLEYEILAVDDGSTDASVISANKDIDGMPGCRYVMGRHHDCRSAMRNDLTCHGRYEWRLMADARTLPADGDFIKRYLDSGAREGEAVCGGVVVRAADNVEMRRLYRENLRFRYERHEQPRHSVSARRKSPYMSMRTTNFFFHYTVFDRVRYDERIKTYGYEDVMLGKALCEAGINVLHIDNPVAYTSFESNDVYLDKLEESMVTLRDFASELTPYSPLLRLVSALRRLHMMSVVKAAGAVFGHAMRRSLLGRRPSLAVLRLYKVCLFAGSA